MWVRLPSPSQGGPTTSHISGNRRRRATWLHTASDITRTQWWVEASCPPPKMSRTSSPLLSLSQLEWMAPMKTWSIVRSSGEISSIPGLLLASTSEKMDPSAWEERGFRSANISFLQYLFKLIKLFNSIFVIFIHYLVIVFVCKPEPTPHVIQSYLKHLDIFKQKSFKYFKHKFLWLTISKISQNSKVNSNIFQSVSPDATTNQSTHANLTPTDKARYLSICIAMSAILTLLSSLAWGRVFNKSETLLYQIVFLWLPLEPNYPFLVVIPPLSLHILYIIYII